MSRLSRRLLAAILLLGVLTAAASGLLERRLAAQVGAALQSQDPEGVLEAIGSRARASRLLLLAAGAGGLSLAGAFAAATSRRARRDLAAEFEETTAALVAERDRFGTVIDGMRGGVLAVDARGVVTVANPFIRRLFGLERPPEGRPLVEALPQADLVALVEGALAGVEGATDVAVPARSGAAGRVRAFRLLVTATPQPSGGCVVLAFDVTELRELEALRREFVADVSHELRTPVSAVRSSAEALEAGALEEPELAAEFVALIRRNAERLKTLLSDLLQLSHIESGALELRAEPVEVAPVAWRVREALWGLADGRSQTLEMDVPMDLSVLGDAVALERVLLNLVENACKYTQNGGRVCLRGRSEEGAVILEVIDDGPGIPEAHRGLVFERFYRVDRGRSRALGGTGLGLAIVRELVEAMGGEVSLLRAEPRGSVLRVELPEA